jgi:hypothetical protein
MPCISGKLDNCSIYSFVARHNWDSEKVNAGRINGHMRKKIIILLILFVALFACKENLLNVKIKFDQIYGLQKGDRVIKIISVM